MYNVLYFDERGTAKTYLGSNVPTLEEAQSWCDRFNELYRKPYPNGQGYYSSALTICEKGMKDKGLM
jgi:hypothetical protein